MQYAVYSGFEFKVLLQLRRVAEGVDIVLDAGCEGVR